MARLGKKITLSNFCVFAQMQLMDLKRQLETQVALNQKIKEQLNAAELELNTLKIQQGSSEMRHTLSSPSAPIIRGWSSLYTYISF